MAIVAYSTMTGEIAPHVSGCPSAVIEAYIRKIVIDLCNRAQIWRVKLADVTLLAGIYAYPMTSPVASTEVVNILSAALTYASNGNVKALGIATDDDVRAMYPSWPDLANLDAPLAITRMNATSFNTVPVPDAVDTYTVTNFFASIRPTQSSTGWEDSLFNEFRRAIYHGVLHELMLMPERNWFNEKMAAYHGKQWEYMLNNARARTNKGFGRADVRVQQRPWA